MTLAWILIIVDGIVCAILCGIVAEAKDRDILGWIFVGLFFGVLGLIAVAGMPVADRVSSPAMTTDEITGPVASSPVAEAPIELKPGEKVYLRQGNMSVCALCGVTLKTFGGRVRREGVNLCKSCGSKYDAAFAK